MSVSLCALRYPSYLDGKMVTCGLPRPCYIHESIELRKRRRDEENPGEFELEDFHSQYDE